MNGIYIDRRWEYWVYRPYLGNGKKGKPIKLCPMDRPESEAIKAKEAITTPSTNCFKKLSAEYLKSTRFKTLKPDTQKSYERAHNQLCNKRMTDGRKLGDYGVKEIDELLLREYLDWYVIDSTRYKHGYVLANRHISYIDTVYSWGKDYKKVLHNPAKITKLKERPKRNKPSDDDYYHALFMPGPAYMPFVMELAYLCRARKNIEVLNIKLKDDGKSPYVAEDGIFLVRGKGSKTQLIAWTPRLKATVEMAKKLYNQPSIYLIHDANGQQVKQEAIKTSWRRRMNALRKNGGKPFTMHSLKRKGVSDFDGDKHKATGDWSRSMTRVYDDTIEIIASTR